MTEDLTKLSLNNDKYDPNEGMLSNISKGWKAYEAWLVEASIKFDFLNNQENSAYENYQSQERELALDKMISDIREESYKTYKDFLLNITDYKSNSETSFKSNKRRQNKSRKTRLASKKLSKLSLFGRYHPGGKY